jgi:hypothetical protein
MLPAGAGGQGGNSNSGDPGEPGSNYGGGGGGDSETNDGNGNGADGFVRILWSFETGATQPEVVALGTVATGTTSVNVSYPAGIQANDIIFLWVISGSTPTIGTNANFTSLAQVNNGTLGGRLAWRRATGSETGSISISATGGADSAGVMIVVRGAIASGTPYEDAASATGGSTSVTSATIDVTGSNRLALRFSALNDNVAGTPPADYQEHVDASTTNTQIIVESKPIATSESAQSRTLGTSETWLVQTLAVLPNE